MAVDQNDNFSTQPVRISTLEGLKSARKNSILQMNDLDEAPSTPSSSSDYSLLSFTDTDLEVDHSHTSIYLRRAVPIGFDPQKAHKPPVIIVHDIGLHSLHYGHFVKSMTLQGRAVYIYDLRGHGRSGKALGHISAFKALVNDLLQVCAWVRHSENQERPYVIGHGFGAIVCASMQRAHSKYVAGVVMLQPTVHSPQSFSWFARAFVKTISDLAPQIMLPTFFTPKVFASIRQAPTAEEARSKLAPIKRMSAKTCLDVMKSLISARTRILRVNSNLLILSPALSSPEYLEQLDLVASMHRHADRLTIDRVQEWAGGLPREAAAAKIAMLVDEWISGCR